MRVSSKYTSPLQSSFCLADVWQVLIAAEQNARTMLKGQITQDPSCYAVYVKLWFFLGLKKLFGNIFALCCYSFLKNLQW